MEKEKEEEERQKYLEALQQQVLDYLQIYKRCNNDEERREIQALIFECEALIARLQT